MKKKSVISLVMVVLVILPSVLAIEMDLQEVFSGLNKNLEVLINDPYAVFGALLGFMFFLLMAIYSALLKRMKMFEGSGGLGLNKAGMMAAFAFSGLSILGMYAMRGNIIESIRSGRELGVWSLYAPIIIALVVFVMVSRSLKDESVMGMSPNIAGVIAAALAYYFFASLWRGEHSWVAILIMLLVAILMMVSKSRHKDDDYDPNKGRSVYDRLGNVHEQDYNRTRRREEPEENAMETYEKRARSVQRSIADAIKEVWNFCEELLRPGMSNMGSERMERYLDDLIKKLQEINDKVKEWDESVKESDSYRRKLEREINRLKRIGDKATRLLKKDEEKAEKADKKDVEHEEKKELRYSKLIHDLEDHMLSELDRIKEKEKEQWESMDRIFNNVKKSVSLAEEAIIEAKDKHMDECADKIKDILEIVQREIREDYNTISREAKEMENIYNELKKLIAEKEVVVKRAIVEDKKDEKSLESA